VSSPSREPVSRRDRPAKPPLSQEAIVTAAVALLRAEGLERLTMRRLAAALDTGAGSLYVYFRNVEHLYAALLDELLGEVDLAAAGPGDLWQDRVACVLASYTGVLFAYPSIARLSIFTRPSGPNSLRLIETLLDLLDEGGVAPAAASWGCDLLVQYATATAAEHSTRNERPSTADEESDLAVALADVSAATYPRLHELKEVLVGGEGHERFRWGIDVLLAGLTDGRSGRVPAEHLRSERAALGLTPPSSALRTPTGDRRGPQRRSP
jgi:AcrR family transcriptional regulator